MNFENQAVNKPTAEGIGSPDSEPMAEIDFENSKRGAEAVVEEIISRAEDRLARILAAADSFSGEDVSEYSRIRGELKALSSELGPINVKISEMLERPRVRIAEILRGAVEDLFDKAVAAWKTEEYESLRDESLRRQKDLKQRVDDAEKEFIDRFGRRPAIYEFKK